MKYRVWIVGDTRPTIWNSLGDTPVEAADNWLLSLSPDSLDLAAAAGVELEDERGLSARAKVHVERTLSVRVELEPTKTLELQRETVAEARATRPEPTTSVRTE